MSDPLSLYFSVLREDTPAQQRKLGVDVSRALSNALGRVQPADVGNPTKDGKTASVNVGELLNSPQMEDLQIWFRQQPAGTNTVKGNRTQRASFMKHKGQSVIMLLVDVPELYAPDHWHYLVSSNAKEIFDRSKENFWHEFTHYQDVKKIKNPKGVAGSKSAKSQSAMDAGEYYNSPLEVNAYIQQGLSRVEAYLTQSKDKQKAKEIMGSSAQDFLKRVRTLVDKQFHKHMSKDTERRLQKKTAQMWTDIMGGTTK